MSSSEFQKPKFTNPFASNLSGPPQSIEKSDFSTPEGKNDVRPVSLTTLPSALEKLATGTPEQQFALIPKTGNLEDGWESITNSAMFDATNSAAWWIHKVVGASQGAETIAYLGPNDLRYTIVLIAAMKAGYTILLPSPRNSPEAQRHLLEITTCTKLLYAQEAGIHVAKLERVEHLQSYQVPSIAELVSSTPVDNYPSLQHDGENSKVIILHTSGSTGFPKPVYITNGGLMAISRVNALPPPEGRTNHYVEFFSPGKSLFSMMPFFHMMGILTTVRTVFHGASLILPPASVPVNGDLVIDILRSTKPSHCLMAPSVLEEMSHNTECSTALEDVDFIFYGGAPMAPTTGEKLNKFTRVINTIGSTEIGPIQTLQLASKDDWEYFEWAPGAGIVMEPYSEGVSEMIVRRNPERTFQALFHAFPQETQWESKDIFQQHPTKPALWRYLGRKDDIIVLSNGEKFTPVDFELAMEAHPSVKKALIVGSGRFQASLLVEPDWDIVVNHGLIGHNEDIVLDIWPTVKEANKLLPSHGHIWQSKIVLASKERPFLRSPKGAIVRGATQRLYGKEIEALYLNEQLMRRRSSRPDVLKFAHGREWLHDAVKEVFEQSIPGFEHSMDDVSIFTMGADSLQVLRIASSLSHIMESRGNGKEAAVLPSLIYKHPTVKSLATFLWDPRIRRGSFDDEGEQMKLIERTIKNYIQGLPSSKSNISPQAGSRTIILTGSTGSLGPYILHGLLSSPHVGKIYCLNRSRDAQAKHTKIHSQNNLNSDFSTVEFLQDDFKKPALGLPKSTYDLLLADAHLILHNAWEVNFNLPLSAFEVPHLSGLRDLVDFSLASKFQAPIVLISSVASVLHWEKIHHCQVPEQVFEDPRLPLGQGYGESKYIAENILAAAAQTSGVRSRVLRLGQIAGSSVEKGLWNPTEWFPSLARTSLSLGLLPESLGTQNNVSWVPVDVAAKSIVEISLADWDISTTSGVEVFHIMNPHPVPWSSLSKGIQDFVYAVGSRNLRQISLKLWLSKLKEVSEDPSQAGSYPAVKLVEFYEHLCDSGDDLPSLEIKNSQKVSPSMRTLGPINDLLMKMWLEQWKSNEEGKLVL